MSYIQIVSDLSDIKSIINICARESFVIFGLGNVLVMPTMEHVLDRHPYTKQLWKKVRNKISNKEYEDLSSLILSKIRWRLVNSEIIEIFHYLKENHISSIALTSLCAGEFGIIKNVEILMKENLKELGLDFSLLSPFKEDMLLNKFNSGIIFSAGDSKVDALENIMLQTKYHPKQVIFIDSSINCIKSAMDIFMKYKMEFYGFHYTEAKKTKVKKIKKSVEDVRFKILETQKRWVSYNEM